VTAVTPFLTELRPPYPPPFLILEKYEEVYLKEYVDGTDLKRAQKLFQLFKRALDRQAPAEVYRTGQAKRLQTSI
jgi:hypothetical protein